VTVDPPVERTRAFRVAVLVEKEPTLVDIDETVDGVTEFEGLEAFPCPTAFVAVTVKVYAWPFVRPVTTWVSAVDPAFASVPPEGLEVTVYPVMAEPPFEGAEKVTLAFVLPAVARADVGAPGTPIGVTEFEADDGELVPTAFTAYTAKV
jgi:hypothetical protein